MAHGGTSFVSGHGGNNCFYVYKLLNVMKIVVFRFAVIRVLLIMNVDQCLMKDICLGRPQ